MILNMLKDNTVQVQYKGSKNTEAFACLPSLQYGCAFITSYEVQITFLN